MKHTPNTKTFELYTSNMNNNNNNATYHKTIILI